MLLLVRLVEVAEVEGLQLLIGIAVGDYAFFAGSFVADAEVGDEAGASDGVAEVQIVGIGCAKAAQAQANVASGGNRQDGRLRSGGQDGAVDLVHQAWVAA